ncbi:hypothetical protein [Nonomuraea aurantiaca]|uniref:hypothetical protein n=1 Tax=Nonomuraea aurantiaca TaxID=2878562 RepID=UPI001CDA3988|nr:hypothetical protein [Nonomuraea aurantiaca]MCA2229992.1 hypothetical protein [Nonomuraea aurantiaca]
MTDPLESRLRAKLEHAATRAPQAPPRFSTEVVSRSRRRRMRRNALVAGICVVAIAAPITVIATRSTDERGDVATVATEPALGNPVWDTTPIGKRLTIDNPSEKRPISFWYATTRSGTTVFCQEYKSRSGGSSKFCSDEPVDGKEATDQGSTQSFPPPATGKVLHYGTAQAKVVRVAAVLKEGERVTGTLQTPQGAPQAIWTVSVPANKTVTALEFAAGEGGTIKRIELRPLVVPEANAKSVGRTVEMPGKLDAGLYETPDKSLIWKLDGQAVGVNGLSPGRAVTERGGPDRALIDMGGKPMKVELLEHKEHWFGITSTKTARVALVFKDGTSVSAGTRPDPWKIGGFRMFAGTQQRTNDLYAEGFKIVGYGKEGMELWHEDHEPTR